MKLIATSLFAGLLLVGCTTSTEPGNNNNNNNNTNTALTVGTKFVYYDESRDENNVVTDADTNVATILSLNTTAQGRTGAVAVVNTSHSDPAFADTSYFIEESNGNLSMYDSEFEAVGDWVTIPLSGSGGMNTLIGSEIDEETGALLESYVVTESRGSGQATFQGKSYAVKKGALILRVLTKAGGIVVNTTDLVNSEVWWSPELHTSIKAVTTSQLFGLQTDTESLVRIERK